MQLANRQCVFCGRSAPEVRITREHVYRKAFKQVLNQTPPFRWRSAQPALGRNEEERSQPHSIFDTQVNAVCAQCNNEWLNTKVERPAEEHLKQMMLGLPLEIDRSASLNISRWAAKTAAVRALVDPAPYPIPSEHFRWIKERLEPPPYTAVWLGRCSTTECSLGRQVRIGVEGSGRSTGHITTTHLGAMALFVTGAADTAAAVNLEHHFRMFTHFPLLQLWPFSGRTSFHSAPPLSPYDIADIGSGTTPDRALLANPWG